MKRKTTTKKIQNAIKDKLLHITKAQKYSKSTRKITTISTDLFRESLDFLCESIFKDCIGWHYERNHETGQYVSECSRMDGSSDIIVTAYLCACDDVKVEDVDKILRVIEEE